MRRTTAGSLAALRQGFSAILELVGYSIGPSSGLVTYLIGFVEIDLMMTAHDHVLREHLLDAVRKAQG